MGVYYGIRRATDKEFLFSFKDYALIENRSQADILCPEATFLGEPDDDVAYDGKPIKISWLLKRLPLLEKHDEYNWEEERELLESALLEEQNDGTQFIVSRS